MDAVQFYIMLFTVGAFLGVYFLPLIVAGMRDHRQTLAIGVLNIFLGWTLLGWVGALVWACTDDLNQPRTALSEVSQ